MSKSKDLSKLFDQLKADYQYAYKNIDKIIDDTVEEVNVGIYEDVSEIFRLCVKAWYKSYKPKHYKRHYALYHMYEIKKHKYNIDYDFGAQYMNYMHRFKTRGGLDYLFKTVFEEGYHGGADKIAPEKEERWGVHPHTGTPWYRSPYPTYEKWGRMANNEEFSLAPKKHIERNLQKYLSGQDVVVRNSGSNRKFNLKELIKPAVYYVLYQYDLFNH